MYRQTYNISRTLVGDTIVDHSDVVASPVVTATTASLSRLNTQWIGQRQLQDETSPITGVPIVCSNVYSGVEQRK